ncbi:MAG: cytochrome c peroxidase, partial [Verrucomicrobiota bacterium JB023]|nr:cytochrome c peroxidase [Verrucomicrobiota bacterium JB023]
APFRVAEATSTHSRPGDPLVQHFKESLPTAFTLSRIEGALSPSSGSSKVTTNTVGHPYPFSMPKNFPFPNLPTDYPMSEERVELGKKLFFDDTLSVTNNVSCSFCHLPNEAFSDPALQPWGVRPERTTRRHSMPLVNLAWKRGPFRWDGEEPTLRGQMLRPIHDPFEMGEDLDALPDKLANKEEYPNLFAAAFGDPAITSERLAIALEQYILSLTSFDSKFDRAAKGEATLTEQEQRGFELFMTENDPRLGLTGADCFHCHAGVFFTNHRFHNNGLKPNRRKDLGLEETTGRETDRYKFSTPSLRNVEITAPYMHDGRFSTLEEVVEHYSTGIHRSPTLDPNISKHPGPGLELSTEDKAALVAFMKTLTDPQFLPEDGLPKEDVDPFSEETLRKIRAYTEDY